MVNSSPVIDTCPVFSTDLVSVPEDFSRTVAVYFCDSPGNLRRSSTMLLDNREKEVVYTEPQ